jgi:hypothetical protein
MNDLDCFRTQRKPRGTAQCSGSKRLGMDFASSRFAIGSLSQFVT